MKWDKDRAAKSAEIFDLVIPTLEDYFDGKILSTETDDSQIAKTLDLKCGIDAIVVSDGVYGISHRVNHHYYETFTIRLYNGGTESEIDHISRSGIKPRYHVQTIVQDGKPIVLSIAKTSDLLYAINHGLATVKTAFTGAKFAVLDWNTLMHHGIPVDIIAL